MKPVEEIAQWIADRKCRGLNDPDTEGCPAQPDQCECEMLDAIAAALRAERERAEAAETLVGIRTQAMHEQLERAEKAEAELEKWRQVRDAVADLRGYGPEWPEHGNAPLAVTSGYALLIRRAEKAEAEKDAALATARNRALEEAAEKCDNFWHPDGSSSSLAASLATAILALRTKEGE